MQKGVYDRHFDQIGDGTIAFALLHRHKRMRTLTAASAIAIATRRTCQDDPLRAALNQVIMSLILPLDPLFVLPTKEAYARASALRRKTQKEAELVECKKVEN